MQLADLRTTYGDASFGPVCTLYKGTMDLLKNFYHETRPHAQKEYLLRLIDLYITGHVRCWIGPITAQERVLRRELWNRLSRVGSQVVGTYYEGNSLPSEKVREMISFDEWNEIFQRSWGDTWEEGRRLAKESLKVSEFGKRLLSDQEAKGCQTLVYIPNGGLEPALLAMHLLGKQELLPVYYTHTRQFGPISKRAYPAFFFDPAEVHRNIEGKDILVIDDYIHYGIALKKVTEFLAQHAPQKIVQRTVMAIPQKRW